MSSSPFRGLGRASCALALAAWVLLGPGCTSAGPVAEPKAPLLVASDLDNMPFAGIDENGMPTGRDVEMMEALAARIGRTVVWKRIPFDTLLPSVQAGLVDVVCATVGVTPERAERVAFGEPYFETIIALVVRSGPNEPRRWADLDGRPVAAGQGTTSERAVRRTLPRALGIYENKTGLAPAERLLMGEVDGVAMDGPAADKLVSAASGTLTVLESPLAIERYALVLPPDRGGLRDELDVALAALRREAWLDALDERWGLRSRAP